MKQHDWWRFPLTFRLFISFLNTPTSPTGTSHQQRCHFHTAVTLCWSWIPGVGGTTALGAWADGTHQHMLLSTPALVTSCFSGSRVNEPRPLSQLCSQAQSKRRLKGPMRTDAGHRVWQRSGQAPAAAPAPVCVGQRSGTDLSAPPLGFPALLSSQQQAGCRSWCVFTDAISAASA